MRWFRSKGAECLNDFHQTHYVGYPNGQLGDHPHPTRVTREGEVVDTGWNGIISLSGALDNVKDGIWIEVMEDPRLPEVLVVIGEVS